jgi:hypothetical protein
VVVALVRGIALGCVAVVAAGAIAATPAAAPAAGAVASSPLARFEAVVPQRVLDTRTGMGAAIHRPGPGERVDFRVGDQQVGVAGATALILNVAIVDAAGPGYVQVTGAGTVAAGATSSINVDRAGETTANLVVVPVGPAGAVTAYVEAGGDLIADLVGVFLPVVAPTSAGRLVPGTPRRVLDTRADGGDKPVSGATFDLDLGDSAPPGTPVVLNVTAVDADADGYVQVLPSAQRERVGASSTVNVARGETRAGTTVVATGPDGAVTLHLQGGAHVVVDLVGRFTTPADVPGTDGLFVPQSGERILDTRERGAEVSAGGEVSVQAGARGAPSAAWVNLTAVAAQGPGYVQAVGGPSTNTGGTSSLNLRPGGTVANATLVALVGGSSFSIRSSAATHLVVDLLGTFTGPAAPDGSGDSDASPVTGPPPTTQPDVLAHVTGVLGVAPDAGADPDHDGALPEGAWMQFTLTLRNDGAVPAWPAVVLTGAARAEGGSFRASMPGWTSATDGGWLQDDRPALAPGGTVQLTWRSMVAQAEVVAAAGSAGWVVAGGPLDGAEVRVLAHDRDQRYSALTALQLSGAAPTYELPVRCQAVERGDRVAPIPGGSYRVDALGRVDATGSAVWRGDLGGIRLPWPIIDIAADGPTGYRLLDGRGGVDTLGDASYEGSLGNDTTACPVARFGASGPDSYEILTSDGIVHRFPAER